MPKKGARKSDSRLAYKKRALRVQESYFKSTGRRLTEVMSDAKRARAIERRGLVAAEESCARAMKKRDEVIAERDEAKKRSLDKVLKLLIGGCASYFTACVVPRRAQECNQVIIPLILIRGDPGTPCM